MPFDDRLKNTQTPSRLYALLQLIQYKPFERKELRDLLQPPALNNSQSSFTDVYVFAKDGSLLEENEDDKVCLGMEEYELASPKDLRKAIVKRAVNRPELIFTRFTAWYLQRGDKVYQENSKTLMEEFDRELNPTKSQNVYNDTNITAWRTWAAFLGYGFILNGILVPNVFTRLSDELEDDNKLERNKIMPIRKFVDWMNMACPELDYGIISTQNSGNAQWPKQHFSTGLSAGLPALHDNETVELSYSDDAADIWHLTTADAHDIKNRVSLIKVRG